ncbi:hypothetical protein [uncultured Paenibacillus sp.]|uniref:hypothetical protein n=1 Tax=uncultured Paenibacillus sp. TaxID=227322 RepID=UPI0015AD89FD|nr:hypothetical protein [uncultured Paenibacillus sp.]
MTTVQEYVARLEQLTEKLVQRIDQVSYEELAAYADQREALANQIVLQKNSLQDEDKQKIRSLSEFDEVILAKMEHFKNEAGDWLLRRGTIKNQRSAYNMDYTPESMFFDRKK